LSVSTIMNIADIKAFLGRYFDPVELVGSGEAEITGPAKIEEAGVGQVSFVAKNITVSLRRPAPRC